MSGGMGHVYRFPEPVTSATFEPGSVKVGAKEITIDGWTATGAGMNELQRYAIDWAIERLQDALDLEGPLVSR